MGVFSYNNFYRNTRNNNIRNEKLSSIADCKCIYKSRIKHCQKAIYTLLCIKKFKHSQSTLNIICKDVILLIAKYIWKTKYEKEWTQSCCDAINESERKKRFLKGTIYYNKK